MNIDKPGLFGSTRLATSLIGFFGSVVTYALRSDLSFAIVCMVDSTAYEDDSSESAKTACAQQKNSTSSNEVNGELLWSKSLQGSVLSAFFWGYTFSSILGGYFAGRFGGKIVIGMSVLLSATLSLICPVAANANVYLFMVVRAIIGFAQGSFFPAFHSFWAGWAPPSERGILTGINYAGGPLGNAITLPISGVLCKYGFAGGWPSIYYILGAVGVAWCALWFLYVADSPSEHRWISKEEQVYIEESLREVFGKEDERKLPVPWRKILTSKAVWGIFAGHFANDWGAYMMLTSLPLFMNDVLGLDLTSMGFIAAVPYLAYFLTINLGGLIADKIQSLGILSTIGTRRSAMIISMGSQAIFLVASGYCGCAQQTLVILFITLGIGLSGFAYAGFVVNYLDIAPTFAGPILGIGNTITCIAGIVGPLIVGWLTPQGTRGEWQLVFWITAAILVAGTAMFCVFAKGEVQPWATADEPQINYPPEKIAAAFDNPISIISYNEAV